MDTNGPNFFKFKEHFIDALNAAKNRVVSKNFDSFAKESMKENVNDSLKGIDILNLPYRV